MFARAQTDAFAALPVASSPAQGPMIKIAPAMLSADNDRYAGGVVTLLVRRRVRLARRANH